MPKKDQTCENASEKGLQRMGQIFRQSRAVLKYESIIEFEKYISYL